MISLIILGFLIFVISKWLSIAKKSNIFIKEGINNYLNPASYKTQVQKIEQKPRPEDPSKSQNSNNSNGKQDESQLESPRIKTYGDFNPDYMNARVEITDQGLNIDLGDKTIKDININGKNIPKFGDNKNEVKTLTEKHRKITKVKESKHALSVKNHSMIKQTQPNIKMIKNSGNIKGYNGNIKEVKEIKGPVKTLFVGKFSSPNGFRVQNFISGMQGMQQIQGLNGMQGMQQIQGLNGMQNIRNLNTLGIQEEQIKLMGESGNVLKGRKLRQPKFLPYNNFGQISTSVEKNLSDGTKPQKVSLKGNSHQHQKMKTLSKEYNNPENKMLSQKEIIKMNQITNQLINEDKKNILSQPGHLPYLNRAEINELNRHKQMYANIYKMSKQSGNPGIKDKKSLREIANRVSMLGKRKQEEASKQASKEVENKMPDINRNAFYRTITGESSLSDKFIDYMNQFIDLDDVELSKEEMKKYREQAEKNVRERNELSPEAIEAEYNKLYKKAKKQKMLDKIFSTNSDELKEITYDIINIPEIGISLFGEEEYYKLIRKVDKISDSEYRQLYSEIRDSIMDQMYGREKNERKNTNRSRSSNRTSYQEYVQRKKQMQEDVNADIKTVLGIGNETDIVAPIKIYTPNVINNEDNTQAV